MRQWRQVSLSTLALTLVLLLAPVVGLISNRVEALSLAAVPTNFTDTVVASVARPTALAFTPDGRMLITTQSGQLRMYQNGTLVATPALSLGSQVCSDFERGLLGVAVDPSFATNRFIYLYYTFNKFNACVANSSSSPVNRVSRFTLSDTNLASGQVVLVDNIPSPNGNHNGGDLQFGKDGLLYIAVGDGGCQLTNSSACGGSNANARRQDILSGKILRITRDGAIPADNPWVGNTGSRRCGNPAGVPAGSGPCQETFAWGLRNPFRIGFDMNAAATRFFINDVGQNAWEEIDESLKGADYGWNVREGFCANGSTTNCSAPPAGMTNPIYAYGRGAGCASITAGAFVPNGVWPAEYSGAYLYADYVCGKIFTLKPNGSGGYTSADFATALGGSSVVHMGFGPHNGTQALYYTTFANSGQIRRVAYSGAVNQPPTALLSATPTSGSAPLSVSFNGGGSSDPDGDALTYLWNFGDGSSTQTSGPTTAHTYNSIGTYTASLQVRDSNGALSNTATVRIDVGNTAPQPAISAPSPSLQFQVGQTITLQGSASDAQDGTLPASGLSWEVILHHDTHVHPFLAPRTGNNITFTAPAPEDLLAATNSYLEIKLTATDSGGLSTTISQDLMPRKVNVTMATNPSGLQVTVNGSTLSGPTTFVSWDGYILNVNAPNQTSSTGQMMTFSSWSDAGAQAHQITTPATAATYTASFVASNITATPTVVPSSNLALNKPATGSAACATGEGPAQAVDGSTSTKWCSLATGTKLLTVDLGASFSVSSFTVKHAGAGGESTSWNTRDFTIQTSADNATWTTVATVTGNTLSTSTHAITARTARYARLSITAGEQAGTTARIYEFEVYGSGGTTPTATRTNTSAASPTRTNTSAASPTRTNTSAASPTRTNTSGPVTCVTGTAGGTWQNSGFASQSGSFTAEFDARTSASPTNSVAGLSLNAAMGYTSLAPYIRFNPSGFIDARNGGAFAAATSIAYSANSTYHVRLVVNVPAHTYSIYITPPGGAEQLLGNNYAFRTEQNTVASLNNLAVFVGSTGASGSTSACSLTISGGGVTPTATRTNTPVGPTATRTNTPVGPTATRTNTPVGPTVTRTPTAPAPNVNLALNKPATASGTCAAGEEPAMAVDGNSGTKWCDNSSATKWLRVDLGDAYSVASFRLTHAGSEDPSMITRDFSIDVSMEGTTWTTVVNMSGNTTNVTTHSIASRSARYVRLNVVMGEQSGNTARIYELEVYGSSSATLTPVPTFTPGPSPTPPVGDVIIRPGDVLNDQIFEWRSAFTGREQGTYGQYRIDMVANTSYTFETSLSVNGGNDTFLYLLNASLQVVASDDDSGDASHSKLTFTPTANGTYYLRLRAYTKGVSGVCRLTVSGQVIPPGNPLYPDLAIWVGPKHLRDAYIELASGRKRLRFSAGEGNRGKGALELYGVVISDGTTNAYQNVYNDNGSKTTYHVGSFSFSGHETHNHWHFDDFARYDLHNLSGTLMATSDKVSFCIMDYERYTIETVPGAPASAVYDCSKQGISLGWADTYGAYLDGQWIDITGVPDGTYRLSATVDPYNRLKEEPRTNNKGEVTITISGNTVTVH